MRRSSEAQRRRLHATFETLCRIESPSGHERPCADWVTGALRELGLEVDEDGAGAEVGSDAGNLLARLPGRGPDTILICTHLDTVPLTAPVEPVIIDGGWENAGEGIVGADNKAAVAVAIELARALREAPAPPEVGVEFLFTVAEELALAGAKAFDASRLRSRFGYVFDLDSPIGEIIVGSPSLQRIDAEFHGRPAHAGIRPEAGRSAILAASRAIAAMPLGRIDPETTANVGTIAGGTAINVVPGSCRLVAETRSLDDARVQAVATEMIDHLQDAANATECDLDVTVTQLFTGYRVRARAPEVQLAEQALRGCGYEPRHIVAGGASDANALQAAGFTCINLANGTERDHEPTERVSLTALEDMLDVALALVELAPGVIDGAAAPGPGAYELREVRREDAA